MVSSLKIRLCLKKVKIRPGTLWQSSQGKMMTSCDTNLRMPSGNQRWQWTVPQLTCIQNKFPFKGPFIIRAMPFAILDSRRISYLQTISDTPDEEPLLLYRCSRSLLWHEVSTQRRAAQILWAQLVHGCVPQVWYLGRVLLNSPKLDDDYQFYRYPFPHLNKFGGQSLFDYLTHYF